MTSRRIDERVREVKAVLQAEICCFKTQCLVQSDNSCLAQNGNRFKCDLFSLGLLDPSIDLVDDNNRRDDFVRL